MRSICLISILALVLVGGWTSYAEKTNVFFVHGANVSEQDARAWASQIFKRLWQSGAQMEFYPIAWESDIGPSYTIIRSMRLMRLSLPVVLLPISARCLGACL